MFGFEIKNVIPRKNFYKGNFANKVIQSVCYDNQTNCFIIGFSHINNANMSTLVKLNRPEFTDNAVVAVKENLPLAHCNDMTYHNGNIYVARGDKTISVVNARTLNIERNVQIDANAWSIARYDNGDFFIHNGVNSRRYNSEFKNSSIISKNDLESLTSFLHIPYDSYEKSYAGYWQGAVMLNNMPYVIYTEWNGLADQIDSGGKLVYNGDSRFKSCILYDVVNKTALRCPTFQEAEGCCVVGNEMYMFFGSEYIGVGVWNMDVNEEHFDTFATVHREIPTGESMNNIFTPGMYRSKNAGKTRTLKDLPNVDAIKTAGFYMEVKNVGLNHVRQTIYSDNFWDANIVITRGYSFDYGWGFWYKYSMTKV